jgi:magnesium-protoporphyrin O-methyltransferase
LRRALKEVVVSSCCSSFACAAGQQFNPDKVAQELKRYREKGPGATTRLLVEGIVRSLESIGDVLDVGGGFGGLTLALLDRGATGAVVVDASDAYITAAREEAARAGRSDRIQFVHADFVEAAPFVPAANVVALDRVICCYPSYEPMLELSLAHACRSLAISYPRAAWYVRLGMGLENLQRRLSGNPFRTFVHPVPRLEELIRRAGFTLASRRQTWMWSVDVYTKRS